MELIVRKRTSPFFHFLLALFVLLLPCPENAYPQPPAGRHTDDLKQGISNLKEENYEEAVEDFKKARMADPDSSIAAYFLGIAYKKVENNREALANLNDAVALQPAVKEAVIELADVLYQLGDMEGALRELQIAEKDGISPAQTSFLKGLVLLKLGKNMDAVESFNKAKSLDEKLVTSANYQIAIASFQEGKLSEAQMMFNEIVVRDPNADIAQFANQYIDAITRRLKEEKPFRGAIGIQYQYDDNVLLKPGDSTAAAGITDEADNVGVVNLRAEYVPKLKGPYGIKGQYSLYLNKHEDLTTHDIQSHTIAVVPNYNLENSSLSLLLGYNYTLVEDEKYLQTVTVSPTYTFTLAEDRFAQVFVRYQVKDYLKDSISPDEDRDGNDSGIGGAWFYLIAEKKGFLNARYEFNREDTDGRNWRYAGHKFGVSFLYPLADKLTFNLGGEGYLQNYEKTHTAFNKKRNDKTYTYNTMFSYNIYDDMNIQAQYAYIRGESNIVVYDYDKNIFTLGVELRF